MTELAYGRTLKPEMQGKAFRNARFFTGPEADAETVWIDGDYPQIEAAYQALGVKVLRLDGILPPPAPEPELPAREPVVVPADWRDLPWTQPDDRGLTLRGLAASVTDQKVINRLQAVAAVEAYLAGQDADQ